MPGCVPLYVLEPPRRAPQPGPCLHESSPCWEQSWGAGGTSDLTLGVLQAPGHSDPDPLPGTGEAACVAGKDCPEAVWEAAGVCVYVHELASRQNWVDVSLAFSPSTEFQQLLRLLGRRPVRCEFPKAEPGASCRCRWVTPRRHWQGVGHGRGGRCSECGQPSPAPLCPLGGGAEHTSVLSHLRGEATGLFVHNSGPPRLCGGLAHSHSQKCPQSCRRGPRCGGGVGYRRGALTASALSPSLTPGPQPAWAPAPGGFAHWSQPPAELHLSA